MKKNGIIGSAFSLTVSALLVKLLGVLYKVPLSYILTDVGMGYFNTAYSIYGVFYVLSSAGVPKAITCIISENKSNSEEVGYSIYRHAIRLFTIIGLIIGGIYIFLSPFLVSALSNEKALLTVLLIGPSILFVSTGGVARGYLSARGELLHIAISQVLEAILKLVIGIAFARVGVFLNLELKYISALAIVGILIGSACSTVYMLCYIKIRKRRNNIGQKLTIHKEKINRDIMKIALPITFGSFVLTFSNVLDVGLIMNCLSDTGLTDLEANELYGNYSTLAVPMINLLVSLVTPLTVALLPRLVELKVGGRRNEFISEVEKTAMFTALFVSPCAAVYYFYSFDILDILFTSQQSAKGYGFLALLSVGVIFLCMINVINTAHESLGNFGITIVSISIAIITKFALSILIIKTTEIGILSVPLCTTLSNFIAFLFSFIALCKKGIKISIIKTVLLPLVLAILCFGVPFRFVFESGIFAGGFGHLCCLIFASFGVYSLLCFSFLSLKIKKKRNN